MSTRQIRKMIGGPSLPPPDEGSDGEFDPFAGKSKSSAFSAFELLGDEEEKQGSEEENCVSEESEEELVIVKKKNKKRKSKRNKRTEVESDDVDVDQLVQEVNEMLGAPTPCRKVPLYKPPPELQVRAPLLDSYNELKKIFTEKVVRAETGGPGKNKNRIFHKTHLVTPIGDWPIIRSTGLTMVHLRNENGIKYFRFLRGNTIIEETMRSVLQAIPSYAYAHIFAEYQQVNSVELLILASQYLAISEELATSTKCIEMALYIFEKSMISNFSLTDGNCMLEYRYPENRMFFVTALLYVNCLTNRVCHRTALEISKMLLCMEPSDPVAILLYIDVLALRSGQYQWLCDAAEAWEKTRNVYWVPGFPYSCSLALFNLSKKDGDTSKADAMLTLALTRFPMFIPKIMAVSNIALGPRVKNHEYLLNWNHKEPSHYLELLIGLYAERVCSMFRRPGYRPWLEKSINLFLDKVDAKDPETMKSIAEASAYRKRCFAKFPLSVARHWIILGLENPPYLLGLDTPSNSNVYCLLDPLPPKDTDGSVVDWLNIEEALERFRQQIIDHEAVAEPAAPIGEARRIFGAFVDSLSPNYGQPANDQPANNQPANNQPANNQPEE